MKKRITILGIDEEISLFFQRELNKIFKGIFEIDYRHPDMEPVIPVYDSDLILYTDPEILNMLIDIIKCDAPKLMMKRTITREALKKIKTIPKGKSALVVNINEYMANETMALIYQLGITNVKLYPFYKGSKKCPDVDYIINVAPEKFDFIPDLDAQFVIIGHRVLDISNILDIISLLRVDNKTSDDIIKKYLFQLPTFWHGIQYTWENRRGLITRWEMLIDQLSDGVIVTDDQGYIELFNKKAEEIFHLNKQDIQTIKITSLFKEDKKFLSVLSKNDYKDAHVRHNGKDLAVTIKSVEYKGEFYGKIILIEPYTEMVKTQQKIHKKIIGQGYYSKYTFSDLIGNSDNFLEAKEIAKKISNSDSTVLLIGESGTGKELFAGAIHNFSSRKNKPFVAINCATLPENLLESELFGYEEGAFTGAKKGGKIGLVERAHKGTLFLDEIGDLPLKLQARLLRVLEEKEIMRVGGDSIISVDVRIIAATNKNLLKLVEEGKFRKDLFFRLNIFQITIPPLKERREDIPLLIDHFFERWNIRRGLCGDFINFYKKYSWPGNIRELKNVLKYMVTVSKDNLCFENLPNYLKQKENYSGGSDEGEKLLLKILYLEQKRGGNTGRRSLTKTFKKMFYDISEMEIRSLIKKLYKKGAVVINKGRAGNEITEKGIRLLKEEGYILD